MNKGTAIVGFLLCFLAGMGLMWGVGQQGAHGDISADATAEAGEWNDNDAGVPVSSKDPMWGNRDALVTMVLFSDFQCPFCTRVEKSVDQLKTKYGPEKLRIIWKQNPLPFHKQGRKASIASQVVFELGGSKAFWSFHKAAFENQKQLTDDNFSKWAVAAGVDKAKYDAGYAKNDASKIDADMAVGKTVGVTGTPASLINGVFLSGAQPVNKFITVIDEQLAAAQKEIAAGTPKDKVYAKLSKINKAKNPAPKRGDKKKPKQDSKTVWKVPAGDSPVKGNKNALVTIVEFSEFQCPFCSKVLPTTTKLLETYGDKVRIVWKDNPLPFHKRANPAAALAREAFAQKGADGFWKAHDLMFANQKKLEDADLKGYAEKLGLNVDKVMTAIQNRTYNAKISADQALAADLQASGTPHFFINGRRLVGAQPFEKFKTIVDEEIKKSQALIEKGVKPAELYATIIKNGKEPPPPEKKTVDAAPEDSPYRGKKDSKIVMQMFSDFECPFCKRVEATLTQVDKTYGDRIKMVWRNKPLPMHKNAPLAAEASVEAFAQKGSAGFWKYHDGLFAALGTPDGLGRPTLDKVAEEIGLDMTGFKAALDSNKHKARVKVDMDAANKAGISGTPAFVVNGYFVSGAQPFTKFKKVIDLAIKDGGGGAAKAAAPKAAAPKAAAPKAPAPKAPAPAPAAPTAP